MSNFSFQAQPIPYDKFTPELLPNEKIHWAGRPNPSVVFHSEDWGVIPFSLLWGGFAIFWLLGASGIWDIFSNKPSHGFEWFGIVWGTPFVAIGQYFIWGRFVHAWWKKRRTWYALTDRRALVIYEGIRGRSAASAFYNGLPVIDKRVRKDGIGIISFGGPVTGEWQWGKHRPPRPTSFDDVDDANSVYRVAITLQEAARKNIASEFRQ